TLKIVELEYKSTHSQEYSLLNHERIIDRQTVFSTDVNTYFLNNKLKKKKNKLKKFYKKYNFTIQGDIYFLNISPNGEFLLDFKNTENGRICDLWDLEMTDKISTVILDKEYDNGGFSSSGNFFYIASSKDSIIKIYELNSQVLIDSFTGIIPFVFAENDQYCAFTDNNKQIHIYDFKNKKKNFSAYTEHQSLITDIKFNLKHNFVASASTDGLVKLWSLDDGKPLVSLAAFNKDDFIYVSPDNYYYSTKGAMNYIGFILKDILYTFDQFDVLFNRPDTVLCRLDYTPDDEIHLFKKAYHKRLKKMGFSSQLVADNYNIPVVELVNMSTIPITTENNTINLTISASDSIYNLDRINIWVNGVPIFGTAGFSVKSKKLNQCKDDFEIVLNSGKNKIDVAAYNSKGTQSLKKSFSISYNNKNVHDLYLVVVGISDYKDDANDLDYAAKDANDIIEFFNKSKNYNNIHITKILNKDAIRKNILAVKNDLQKTKVDDEVILFYAGHGFLDEDFNYYLTCHDFDYLDFFTSTVEYDEFIAVLDSIPARNKLVLIDACHSGEVDADGDSDRNTKVVNVNESQRGENDRSLWTREFGDMPELGSQSSFELMKIIFADLRIGSGATIISSAGGQEYAYESDKIKNGVFTYVLINGLKSKDADLNKDGKIMISELQDYVMKTVSSLTKGRQNPTNRRQNLDSDFV
ncbi:MAG: caspase family protein, partial [Bacteroidota bacterium]|nr:caspase family protein [Bacteroidota bacterium]